MYTEDLMEYLSAIGLIIVFSLYLFVFKYEKKNVLTKIYEYNMKFINGMLWFSVFISGLILYKKIELYQEYALYVDLSLIFLGFLFLIYGFYFKLKVYFLEKEEEER